MRPVTLRADLPDGGRLVLRAHEERDVEGVLEQCRDPEMARWTTIPQPYERHHAESFVREIEPAGWRDGTSCGWAMEVDGAFAGTLDLRLQPARAADVGYGVVARARGREVVPTALRVACRWGFDQLGLEVVHWEAFVGNWSSRRAAWKAGFRVEGRVRSLLAARDVRYDAWIGSLRHDEPTVPATPWLRAEVLHGERVVLRPWRDEDAAEVVEAANDPVSRHFLAGLPSPYGVETALEYVRDREEQHATGQGVYWCIADPADDRCLGSIGVMGLRRTAGVGEIGYWTVPAARGRGVMTDAVRTAARYALAPDRDGGLGLEHLTLWAAAGNAASRAVAERAGFAPAGRLRRAEPLGDGTRDDLVGYDLLAEDLA